MHPKSQAEVKLLRQSGKMLATVLQLVSKHVQAGVSTKELAQLADVELTKLGGKPAFLGYQGFSDVICVSVNDEVVHGIPGNRTLKSGDVVGLDYGVNYGGMITDAAVTVAIEPVAGSVKKLLKATQESLAAGIAKVKAGARVDDLSQAIERRLKKDGLGIVESLVGHGVGHSLHEPPEIPNYSQGTAGPVLRHGMSIAIEPMATLGGKQVFMAPDGWTVKTQDGSLAAQFEHTVLVEADGAEILTQI